VPADRPGPGASPTRAGGGSCPQPGPDAIVVPDLADGAVIAARTLYFLVGNTTISLATTGPAGSTEDNVDSLRRIAACIIGRL
jgi:hypothetical protein